MVRIAGSYLGFAQTFKAVADHYGWTHIVLVTNDDTKVCSYGANTFDVVFAKDHNYMFTWLRMGAEPTDEQLDDILQQIRSRTRGSSLFGHSYRFINVKKTAVLTSVNGIMTLTDASKTAKIIKGDINHHHID